MHHRFHIFNCQSIVIAAATVMMVAACGKDENYSQIPEQTLRPLTIEVTETPYIAPDDPVEAPGNRAAIITTSTLSSFAMRYVYGSSAASRDITSTKNGEGKWTSSGVWPAEGNDVLVNWYAKTAGTFYRTNDENRYPYISFSVNNTPASHEDLLVATASGTYSGTGGKLTFCFDHACAALQFYVKKATNLNAYSLTVTEITLCNVKKQGDYYYGTSSWSNVITPESYVLYCGSAKTLGSEEEDYQALLDSEGTPYLFLIPQTLTKWDVSTDIASTTDTYLRINCTIMNGETLVHSGHAYIPFAATLEKGHQYNVKINIDKNSLYKAPNTKIFN